MIENSDIEREKMLRRLAFVRAEALYCLMQKSKFDMLPREAQARSHAADAELLRMAGVGVDDSTRDVYLFSSEGRLAAGIRALHESVPRFHRKQFRNISSDPLVMLEAVRSFEPKSLMLDFGHRDEQLIEPEKVHAFVRLAEIDRIADRDYFYVVEDADGFAVTMQLEGKDYALAFLNEQEGLNTMHGLEQTNPGCSLRKNKPLDVAENIRGSTFAGLVFNPASPTQEILGPVDIKRLVFVCQNRRRLPRWAKKAMELIGAGGA